MIDTLTEITIKKAHERIKPFVHRTPVLCSQALDEAFGASLHFKCENFQKVGAFKARGATNAVLSLSDEEAAKGVATHSSGNHAQALAWAAKMRGIGAHIVMPKTSPRVKVSAVRGYGADITFCEPTLKAREETLSALVKETGASFIHPYNDERIIAGQASAAKELLEDVPDLDAVITPVGGGGLLSASALAARWFSQKAAVFAGEPQGADDAYRSFVAGRLIEQTNPMTIADGLLTSLGEKTFPIIMKHVENIFTVGEQEIIEAMRLLFERMKIVVEPSASVALAAVEKMDKKRYRRIGVILSGGNVDLERLPFSG